MIQRAAASFIFTLAGLAYMFFPPRTTAAFFDSEWPAVAWGAVFTFGGVISALGVLTNRPHHERLGVSLVLVAACCLTIAQFSVMFEIPITWTRGGGTLAYLGFTMWAFDRWKRLGREVETINEIADRRH